MHRAKSASIALIGRFAVAPPPIKLLIMNDNQSYQQWLWPLQQQIELVCKLALNLH